MDKRWKFALAALLGFSTACSTVRRSASDEAAAKCETAGNTETGGDAAADGGSRAAADTVVVEQGGRIERIRLMYGVPSPRPETVVPAETKGAAEKAE